MVIANSSSSVVWVTNVGRIPASSVARALNVSDKRMKMKPAAFRLLWMTLLVPAIASAEVLGGGIRFGHGRLLPTTAALVGLLGVLIGRRALTRSADHFVAGGAARKAPVGAIAAMTIGLIVVAIGALHTLFSAGGFGTGNGLAGALVAMAMGLVSLVVGGLALARGRRDG
jgi:hypothetical protein